MGVKPFQGALEELLQTLDEAYAPFQDIDRANCGYGHGSRNISIAPRSFHTKVDARKNQQSLCYLRARV